MLPLLNSDTGALPMGRYGASIGDVEQGFVDAPHFSSSVTRKEIWEDFWSATSELRRIVPVICVWVGGSFLTEKVDPDDIDVVYWCQDEFVDRVTDPKDRMLLQLFAQNQIRRKTGLRVDTRYCRWYLYPEADRGTTLEFEQYASQRGYWDDFWMRSRSGAKGAAPRLTDALPRRGYCEIELDGFHDV